MSFGIAQGIFQQVAEGDGEQGEGGIYFAALVQIKPDIECLPLQQRSEAGQLLTDQRGHLLQRSLHCLLAAQQQEGLGEQRHLVGGGADAGGGAGCWCGQIRHLAEQGRRALDHHVGGAQLVAGEAAELLLAGEHSAHLLLAGQQRLLDIPQLLPGGVGLEIRLIRGEVGDPLLQPLQRPRDMAHQPDAEAEAAQQQGHPDQSGGQMQLVFVGVEVVVGVVVEDQIEQSLAGGVTGHQKVFVLLAQLVLEKAGGLVGLQPFRQAARFGPVAGELSGARGSGGRAESQPVIAVAGYFGFQPVAQAQLLHLVLGHQHQAGEQDQQHHPGAAERHDQAAAQARQAHALTSR